MLALVLVGLFIFAIVFFLVAYIMTIVLFIRTNRFEKKELPILIDELTRLGDEHNAYILGVFFKDITELKLLTYSTSKRIVSKYLPHYLNLLVNKYPDSNILIRYKKLRVLGKAMCICRIPTFLLFGLLIALFHLNNIFTLLLVIFACTINIIFCLRVIFNINKYPKDIDALYEHYCNAIEKQS